ncbi:hypothetical protein G9A89_017432 [Geosiphon pyriformis]|nr:hypothetical protein G9A89_017432 [Geosiphon pyriformis]
MINPVLSIDKQQQQLLQPPQQPQQLLQQQQQQQQQPNIDPMVYAPIAKLEKFTSEENDAQVWLNNVEKAIVANSWNDTRAIGLHSSILQHICPIHPVDLQAAITNTRDFKAAELKANHTQAINLVVNGSSELDFKLKQFSNSINQKLEEYLANNCAIYQSPQRHNNLGITNCPQNQSCSSSSSNQPWQQETRICHYCDKQEHLRINCWLRTENQ